MFSNGDICFCETYVVESNVFCMVCIISMPQFCAHSYNYFYFPNLEVIRKWLHGLWPKTPRQVGTLLIPPS